VHAPIESKDRRRFVLTGSSARKLRRGGVDLLAAHAVHSDSAFMASEVSAFDFGAALRRGLLPLVVYLGYQVKQHNHFIKIFQGYADQWKKRWDEEKAGKPRAMFDPREEYFRSIRDRTETQNARDRDLFIIQTVPIGSLVVILVGLWIAKGFKAKSG
jgi:hypothetical protein